MGNPKIFINADEFLLDSFRLAKRIYNSGYVPSKLIGVWRWGAEICSCIDELYRFKDIRIPNYPVKSEHYDKNGEKLKEVSIFDVESLKKVITNGTLMTEMRSMKASLFLLFLNACHSDSLEWAKMMPW